jgi:hypothetical protein
MIQKHGQIFRQFFQSWFINILPELHIVHIQVLCLKICYLLNFTLQSQLLSMKSQNAAYGLSATVILSSKMETKHINNHNKLVTNCVQNKVVFTKNIIFHVKTSWLPSNCVHMLIRWWRQTCNSLNKHLMS